MGPRETGMWERDSDGGELPDRASGSCHTGLISPVTRQEARPVTCCAFQQVMKAGRMALGWQEPAAVRRKNARTRCHVHHVDQAAPSLILLHWDSCEYGLCMALMDGCVYCMLRMRRQCVCSHVCVWHPWSQQQLILNVFTHKNTLNEPWVFKLLCKNSSIAVLSR